MIKIAESIKMYFSDVIPHRDRDMHSAQDRAVCSCLYVLFPKLLIYIQSIITNKAA